MSESQFEFLNPAAARADTENYLARLELEKHNIIVVVAANGGDADATSVPPGIPASSAIEKIDKSIQTIKEQFSEILAYEAPK